MRSVVLILLLSTVANLASVSAEPPTELVDAVSSLGLGEGNLILGDQVAPEVWQVAQGALLEDAYPGTVKFRSGEVVVVADAATRRVLALYQRMEEATAADVRSMVGGLMERFGEPTTMAHDKLIYWAYGPSGKIDQETYEAAKAQGEIEILATVKFSSSIEVSPGLSDETVAEPVTIYYIIASDPLLADYVSRP